MYSFKYFEITRRIIARCFIIQTLNYRFGYRYTFKCGLNFWLHIFSIPSKRNNSILFLRLSGCQCESQSHDAICEIAMRFFRTLNDLHKMTRLRYEELIPVEGFGRGKGFDNGSQRNVRVGAEGFWPLMEVAQ